MEEHPLGESAWKRGWRDTKAVWTSWQFYILDAIGGVIVGGVFGWYWGLALIAFGMICIWMGAIARAPIKQRNEARGLLQAKPKPKPLSNREMLLKALVDVQNSAMELVNLHKLSDNVNWMGKPSAQDAWDKAYQLYKHSLQDLDKELVVAGEAYELSVLRFKTFVQGQVYLKIVKPTQIGGDEEIALGKYKFPARLGGETKRAIRSINQISGQVPDKKGSQT